MTDFEITAAQIETATGGTVDQKALVNWNERGHWLSELQPHQKGRARLYSYENALEAVLAGSLAELGLSRELAKTALMRRVSYARGASSGWVGVSPGELVSLPEFAWPVAYWAIVSERGVLSITPIASVAEIDPDMQSASGFRVLAVSAVKAGLDAVLASSADQAEA